MFEVKKAKRQRRPMKISLEGVSGAGKTFTALRLAFAMKRAGVGKRIVVADSENESAGLYDGTQIDGERWEYDVCPIPAPAQNPAGYAQLYEYLVGQGFDIILIDSMTHAWHGAMEQVDKIAGNSRGDKFQAWAKVTPDQRRMLAVLTDPRAHLIATMRVKSEYERVTDERTGKEKIKKVGTRTDQREGSEYEFDAVIRLEQGHDAWVEKVRGCTAMDGRTANCPGPDFWKPLFDWWLSAEPVSPVQAFDDARAALKKPFASDADLFAVWKPIYQRKSQFTADQFAALERLKDEAKFALQPAQQQPAAAQTPPAQPTWADSFVAAVGKAAGADLDALNGEFVDESERLTDADYTRCREALNAAFARTAAGR